MRERWRKAQAYELDFWKKHEDALPDHGGPLPRDLQYVSAEIGDGDAVLEVGCGPMGAIFFAPGALRLGIDPLARSYVLNLDFSRRGVDLVGGVGERMPLRDGSFDTIICGNVLDHVNEPRATLTEMRRVLKRGGVLVLVMHVIPGWLTPTRRVLDRVDTGHPYHLTQDDVRAMIEGAGFEEIESDTEAPGLGWYSVKAALGNFAMRNLRMKCRPNGDSPAGA